MNKEEQQFAIAFANWLDKLSIVNRISVWSKDGQYSGLFQMDNEQLMATYLRHLNKQEDEKANTNISR
jgi:hypothetical protein